MSSSELDDLISSSTIRILADSADSADCPPSSSQVSSCCSSSACAGDACPLRESPCISAASEDRLQLVVTVSRIPHSCYASMLYALKLEVGTLGHRSRHNPARARVARLPSKRRPFFH